jgi:hypothetical protein
VSVDDDKIAAREALAFALRNRLAGHNKIDDAVLVRAAQVLLEGESSLVARYASMLGVNPDRVRRANTLGVRLEFRVENMQSMSNLAHKAWKLGDPLPPGNYEVSVVFKGQENVIISTNFSRTPEEIAEEARKQWLVASTVKLGTEYQVAEEFIIKPIPDS